MELELESTKVGSKVKNTEKYICAVFSFRFIMFYLTLNNFGYFAKLLFLLIGL